MKKSRFSDEQIIGFLRQAVDFQPELTRRVSFAWKLTIEEMSPTELTLAHEAVPALQWPAMTMGFKLSSSPRVFRFGSRCDSPSPSKVRTT